MEPCPDSSPRTCLRAAPSAANRIAPAAVVTLTFLRILGPVKRELRVSLIDPPLRLSSSDVGAYCSAMTPTQLRAFAAVVRVGSVGGAASELGVTNAAVSAHVGQLRKELHDPLFHRSGSGLAFTPGGLRLASRAGEILGLQDRTVREVGEAGSARRVLRLAVSSTFAEFSAPGLIEVFSTRADDLDVEMSVHSPTDFEALLAARRSPGRPSR